MSNQNFQDWTTVVFKKKPTQKRGPQAPGTKQDGLLTVKKSTAGKNQPKADSARLRKIDETEIAPLPKMTMAMRQAIIKGRASKNLTQQELAAKLNVRVTVVQDYESGKAIPDARFITKIEKVLDTKINGLK